MPGCKEYTWQACEKWQVGLCTGKEKLALKNIILPNNIE